MEADTDKMIKELEALERECTPAPWKAEMERRGDGGYTDSWSVESEAPLDWSRSVDENGDQEPYVTEVFETPPDYMNCPGRHGADARFSAAARNYMPHLIAALKEQREVIAKLRPNAAQAPPTKPTNSSTKLVDGAKGGGDE